MGGVTWVLIKEQDMEFNIAAFDAGQKAGDYISGVAIPEGTYNRIEITISASFKMKGYKYWSGTNSTYFTTSTGTQSKSGNVTPASADGYDEQTITIPGQTTITETKTETIVVKKGLDKKVRISFDVSDTLVLYDNYSFYPAQPTVTITYP